MASSRAQSPADRRARCRTTHEDGLSPAGPLTVLDGFLFDRGQSAAVMGPSGSGKVALYVILGGLEPPTSGVVRLGNVEPHGLDSTRLAVFRNAHVGFVFQDHRLLPQCTVLENVLVPTLVVPATTAPPSARTLLRRVGLGERLDHRPAALSGGEKRRAIARAHSLAPAPPLRRADRQSRRRRGRERGQPPPRHADQQTILLVVTHCDRLAARFERALDDHSRPAHAVTRHGHASSAPACRTTADGMRSSSPAWRSRSRCSPGPCSSDRPCARACAISRRAGSARPSSSATTTSFREALAADLRGSPTRASGSGTDLAAPER